MRIKVLLGALFISIAAGRLAVAEEVLELAAVIGMDLNQAYQTFGVPAQVYALRGSESWQDDVVFYYPEHIYLFWFRSRVWQVRVDSRYAKQLFSLHMGDSRERILEIMGAPEKEFEDSLLYHLEDRGYPVRARFYFEDGVLTDVYCFRGDL
jgi:hypothetical protein